MKHILDFIENPLPWYVSGPLLGLIVPLLILTSNKQFGVSSSFRHVCSWLKLSKSAYFKYNYKEHEWATWFVFGIFVSGLVFLNFSDIHTSELSETAKNYFLSKNIPVEGFLPKELFSPTNLFSLYGLLLLFGGFLIGFGSRYADGCTSGHTIMGLSLLSSASLVASIGFFIGGVFGSFFILDFLF